MAAKTTKLVDSNPARALQSALQSDLTLAKTMLCVLNAQTEALLANDARSVAMMEKQCRSLASQQEEGDKARMDAIDALMRSNGVTTPDGSVPHLSDLALRMPLSESRAILALRRELLSTHQHIQRANERNRVLLENALSCIESTIETVRELAFANRGYGTNLNTLGPSNVCLNQTA
jgi:hypothetical protein